MSRAAALLKPFICRFLEGGLVGKPLPGTLPFLTALDGSQVIGLRFTAAAPLAEGATYTVVLKGGVGGIMALDGRQMPEDYRWNFTVRNQRLFLPIVMR